MLPISLIRLINGLFYGWHGNYLSWSEAQKKCTGYNAQNILEKVKSSALKVKQGHAVYERDSLLFDKIQYSFALLSGLMWIAAQKQGKINVLDFGGSLGSTYYQNKLFLDSLGIVNWCIVEQSEFVRIGQESFADNRLHFHYSIEECVKLYKIDLILLSSVIQYIEAPWDLIDKVISVEAEFIIIDRTPFVTGEDRITIQKVNPKLYTATYPCWFFNKEKFLNKFKSTYKLLLEFDALDRANIPSEFKGFLFQKNN
jgi:putative methyltransferase (TIGR04325 family)